MKAILLIGAFLLMAQPSRAAVCELMGCATAITIDSGSGYRCQGPNTSCNGASGKNWNWCNYYFTTGSCSGIYQWTDNHMDGRKFCSEGETCSLPPQAMGLEVTGTSDLNEVFGMNMSDTPYYGWVNNANKSPSAGRTTAAKAKLDACLFYTDVDAIQASSSTDQGRWENCVGSSIGCGSTMKNDHCENNGASVCIDRCDCVYTSATGGDGCQGY